MKKNIKGYKFLKLAHQIGWKDKKGQRTSMTY